MSAEEEERFEQSDICWICSKLIENSDEKQEIIVISVEIIELLHTGVVILT